LIHLIVFFVFSVILSDQLGLEGGSLMENFVLFSFLVYGVALLFIGWLAHKKTAGAEDFLIGDRKVSYWVTALSAHASDMSSWLFLGFPVAVYFNGLSEASAAIGLLAGMAATWKFVAPRLRAQTEETGSVTLSHFFSSKVGDKGRLITIVAAFASIFFFVFYIASGLKGMSTLLHSLFQIAPTTGLLLSASLVIAYTVIGGC